TEDVVTRSESLSSPGSASAVWLNRTMTTQAPKSLPDTSRSRAVLTRRIKTSAAVERTMDAFRKFVSGYALIISVLIAPPIFERFFAMLYLFQGERVVLWIASLLLISISLYGFFGRLRPTWVYFVLFNLLVLISVELGARSAVKLFFPNKEVSLARRAAWTYDELRRMTGHPFLQ